MPHAIRVHSNGGAEALRFEEVEVPAPGPGEARLQQTAIGLNFIDVYHRTGLYPLPLPAVLGTEGAGVIEALGEGVEGFAVGERVAYATVVGAYATHRLVPASRLVKLPEGISDELAAATLLKGMTAEFLVRRCFPVQAGQRVLIHAAAGGVGLLACQWAKALGATVLGTVGSEDKVELARAAGCAHVLVLSKGHLADAVREVTEGAMVHVVYDSIGKDTFAQSLECLARRGMLVSFGQSSGQVPPMDALAFGGPRSLYFTRPSLFAYTATRAELDESAGALFAKLNDGSLSARIGQRFALKDAAEAHRALEGRRTTGATVLLP
jgi:NADPH2:quinone reductase